MSKEIKLSFCVAYDWYFLQYSLPLVYKDADQICLSIDKERISWAGNRFEFDESGFRNLIKEIDTENKIRIYEDDFHLPQLSPMQNEIRQRKMMAAFLGVNNGWHLQLDSDEYFLNFPGFVQYLKKLKPRRPINVCCPWITLYKRIDEGFLMVNPTMFSKIEFIPIATNTPDYEHGRRNGYFNHYTNFAILHQSWARSSDEVWLKLNNWGHRYDSDIDAHFKMWREATGENYQLYKNFNQVKPSNWPSLSLLPLRKDQSVLDLIQSNITIPTRIKNIDLKKKNSIWASRILKLISRR
ncbi:MAG: hypothetical protein QM530_06445 [Phycisphaerales bacterium]|nr:hypothetical protein [Phycisphaerales bacterium]